MNYKPENKQIIISTGSTTTTTKADKYLSLSLHKLMAANKIYKKRINAADRSQITHLNHQQAPQAKPQANSRIMNQKRRTRLSTGYRDMSTGQRAMGPNELASWRRFKTPASRAEPAPRRRELIRTLAICTVLTMLLSTSQCLARDLSQMTFIQSQQSNQQQQLHISSNPYGACKLGAPLQWRPYLDASSKAYLAPVVALASLEHFTLAPIQLTTAGINAVSGSSSASPRGSKGGLSSLANELRLAPQPSLVQHVQSVNNVGVLIEATFKLRTILRRPPIRGLVDLRPGKLISLHYKVSASLATTSDMLALAHSMEQANQTRPPMSGASGQGHTASLRQPTGNECALELSENELSRKGGDLFKLGRDYVLFIEPAASSGINVARKLAPNSNNPRQQLLLHQQQQQQQQQQQVTGWTGAGYGQDHSWSWHAFASHEPASNQTNRSVNRVLCKNCVRPPMVRLVNTTVVSVATTNQQQQQQQPRDSTTTTKRRIKLDCRVSGNPTPWVEWFRNGKLLRNKSGRTRIRTSPWRGRPNERLSRLELELSSGRNETGVYECRAMSVAAREPAVGTYTLLVLPAQFALFPMLHQTTGNGGNAGRLTNGELGEGGRAQKSATKTNNNKTELASRDGQPGAATPATATANTPAQAAIGAAAKTLNSGGHSDGVTEWAGSTATTTTTTTLAPSTPAQQQQQQQQDGGSMSNNNNSQASSAEATPSKEGTNQSGTPQPHQQQQQPSQATSKGPPSSPVVVGQPCPREAHDNFCLNRGTCVLIGHIDEYFCNCAEGYHGHRCEYKSLGYQINSPNNHH